MRVGQTGGMDSTEPPVIPTPAARRFAVFLKVAGIGFLLLLLQIPLVMTHGVLKERQGFQRQAEEEIAGLWGRQQCVTGPVLVVPYTYTAFVTKTREVNGRAVQVDERVATLGFAYFLPETLQVDGTVDPELRSRGIYSTVVYNSKLRLTGEFRPDFGAAKIGAERIEWDKAVLLLGISDLHGIRAVTAVAQAGVKGPVFEANDGVGAHEFPLAAAVTSLTPGQPLAFDLQLTLQGSGRIALAPVGKTTRADLRSAWTDPSFNGRYLPVARNVGAAGFTASWETSHLNRGFPNVWAEGHAPLKDMLERINAAAFGVTFARPVDGYGMVERAQKYGTLFFVQIFAVFFLFEVTARLRIHPLQYAMVGAALCLFFLGFLALTEFWSTAAAYTVAAGACTLLVGLYSWSFLRTGLRTLVIGGGLAGTYGYLYFVLQSQDYALVAGTVALFAMLALVMYCTRRINWYSLDVTGTPNAAASGPV
jgi:inner membrane protein